jgi:arylsulfatase A-like enzyme
MAHARLLIAALLAFAFAAGAAADDRPNIVIILADDMGFSDVGCYGSEIPTPHIDSLAARGVRFTQFYNCGRCCPTRASLLTGLYPHQAGIGYMEPTNKYNRPIAHLPQYQGVLHDRCVTIAEALGAAGYQTFMAGKWHVGSEEDRRPLDRGFERFFGLYGGACNFFRPRQGQIVDQDQPLWPLLDDFYTTDYFAAYAARFIAESERHRPLFLYLAFTAPHWPLHAWPEDIARHRGKYRTGWDELRRRRFTAQKQMGLFPPGLQLSPRHPDNYDWAEADQDDMDLRMAVYAAMVERMDQGIGKVLQTLRDSSREDNTLVLFLSDNGGCAEPLGKDQPNAKPPGPADSFTGYFLPWANASNTPFRLFKHWVHEGGIATPLIACWPERIPSGVINSRQVGHVIDLMPTCLEAAGATYPQERNGAEFPLLEGRSLLHAFVDPESACPVTLYWEHEGNRAVREGRWKLVSYYNEIHEEMGRVGTGRRTGPWELYDLQTDRTELRNLAAEHPERVRDLVQMYEQWTTRLGVRDWQELLRLGGFDNLEGKQ